MYHVWKDTAAPKTNIHCLSECEIANNVWGACGFKDLHLFEERGVSGLWAIQIKRVGSDNMLDLFSIVSGEIWLSRQWQFLEGLTGEPMMLRNMQLATGQNSKLYLKGLQYHPNIFLAHGKFQMKVSSKFFLTGAALRMVFWDLGYWCENQLEIS